MSPASGRKPIPRPRPPKTAKPWQRAEAGRHRSADGRFTLESDGGGRWFVTDAVELDELGLARTSGPFPTLAAAKAAADATRDRAADPSPLADRLAEAASRPRRLRPAAEAAPTRDSVVDAGSAASAGASAAANPAPEPRPADEPAAEAVEPRTWLDDLGDADRDAAVRARKIIGALERAGIADADAVVRRDLLGGTPAIVTRLLARDVVAALARLKDPSAAEVAAAVAAVLAASPRRGGLPGWRLVERDGPDGQARGLRLTADDLLAAAGDDHD